jgi:hypothetical protein
MKSHQYYLALIGTNYVLFFQPSNRLQAFAYFKSSAKKDLDPY